MTFTTPTPPTIDFAQVRSRCPKAFAAFLSHWFGAPTMGEHILSLGEYRRDRYIEQAVSHPRDLFDFFDEKGLVVVIDSSEYKEGRIFYARIAIGRRMIWVSDGYSTRAAAEAAAFTAGFGKLEEILTKKEG